MTSPRITSNSPPIGDAYETLWRRFVDSLVDFAPSIGTPAQHEGDLLHHRVGAMLGVPYRVAHELLAFPRVDATSSNIGSVTGLFFEFALTSAIVPRIRAALPDVRIGRNAWAGPRVAGLPRDPDVHATTGARQVVFEFKVAPKKRDLTEALVQRARWAEHDIPYFFVGGYPSASLAVGSQYADQQWAAFIDRPKAWPADSIRLPLLDDVLSHAIAQLAGA